MGGRRNPRRSMKPVPEIEGSSSPLPALSRGREGEADQKLLGPFAVLATLHWAFLLALRERSPTLRAMMASGCSCRRLACWQSWGGWARRWSCGGWSDSAGDSSFWPSPKGSRAWP